MAKKKLKRAPRTNKSIQVPNSMDDLNRSMKAKATQFVPKNTKGTAGKYLKIDARKMYMLAFAGHDDAEIATIFDVSPDVFRSWQNPNSEAYRPEVVEALYKGRDGAVSSVAHALYRRARGYRHKQQVLLVGKGGKIETHEVIKQHPPDFSSASFILKNKRPKDWQDKQTIENQGVATVQPVINIVTDPESIKRLMKLKHEKQTTSAKDAKGAAGKKGSKD
jgi:hypothetical protein